MLIGRIQGDRRRWAGREKKTREAGKQHVLEETPGLLPLSSGLAPSFATVCSNMAIRFLTLILAVLCVVVLWQERFGVDQLLYTSIVQKDKALWLAWLVMQHEQEEIEGKKRWRQLAQRKLKSEALHGTPIPLCAVPIPREGRRVEVE